jgi:hypothetical protein
MVLLSSVVVLRVVSGDVGPGYRAAVRCSQGVKIVPARIRFGIAGRDAAATW